MRALFRTIISTLFAVVIASCGSTEPGPTADPLVTFGKSTMIVVVNPTATAPGKQVSIGEDRVGVTLALKGTEIERKTDRSGMTVFRDLPAGRITLSGGGGELIVEAAKTGEVIDLAVSTAGDVLGQLALLTYGLPAGSKAIEPEPGKSIGLFKDNNAVYLLKAGDYPEPGTIGGSGIVLWGKGPGKTRIKGDVSLYGDAIRLRGLTINGSVSVSGGRISIVLCEITGDLSFSGRDAVVLRTTVKGEISGGGAEPLLLDVTKGSSS